MPRAGLDTERIVAEALVLLDEERQDVALSALARRFGVAVPSLYKHVGGFDDLMSRVAARATRALADALESAVEGQWGGDALSALAQEYRAFARRHPGSYPLTQRPRPESDWQEASDRVIEVVQGVLAGDGRGVDVHSLRAVRSALHGFVDLERSNGFAMSADIERSFDRLIELIAVARTG